MIHLHFSYDFASSFHTWVPFFEFFLYQEFDEIFPQKLSKVVEVTLEGKKLINS